MALFGSDRGDEVGPAAGPGDAYPERSRGDYFVPQTPKVIVPFFCVELEATAAQPSSLALRMADRPNISGNGGDVGIR
jgi:hypothetical protein